MRRVDSKTRGSKSFRDMDSKDIMQMMILRRLNGKANTPDTTPPTVTVRKPEFLPSRDPPSCAQLGLGMHAIMWSSQAVSECYLIQCPKRYTEPACQVKDIPVIDAVVISHNHYDHLSYPTISEIAKRHPNCHFFAPLGNKSWFHNSGIKNVTELDWWDESDIAMSPKEGKTPQHVTARTPFDKYKTLWASWAIESGGSKVYFAGDSGYRAVDELPEGEDDWDPKYNFPICPAFEQVGEFRGPFDLGLIPIGAYAPRHIFSAAHSDPHDAVRIFKDTKCKQALAMHWGTWVLTEEDVLEPPKKLKEALKKHDLAENGVFDVCEIGRAVSFE
ncbi:N-acyl-phosphatidylethanolamine-hydrolyzing phospholipase D [Penicillium expansum]|nr:N-acyl-phosphatidylethanolamine-hydrolyzing phospholipase D [Penicillium expansum]